MSIRVAVVDDDPLVRAGLSAILGSAGDLEVVGEAGDGSEAPALVRATRPDVVVMDVRMPCVDGISATREITALDDAPQVLVLTTFHVDDAVFQALRAGAAGFLLKDTPPEELIAAVRVVAAGEAMLTPADTRSVIDRFARTGQSRRRATARTALDRLSDREREVAEAVAQGLSNAEIGQLLYCSEATVKTHLTHAFAKLGYANRVRLAILVRDAQE